MSLIGNWKRSTLAWKLNAQFYKKKNEMLRKDCSDLDKDHMALINEFDELNKK